MRIVYTVLNGRIAGGQMVCLQILEAARARGHDVCLVTPSCGELTDRVQREGVPVVILPLERTFQFHRAMQLAGYLRRWKADLVHTHAFVAGSILARLAGRMAGVPVICHMHAHPTYSARPTIRAFQLFLERATVDEATHVAVCNAVVESVRAARVPVRKIRVIHNGVALPTAGAVDMSQIAHDLNYDSGIALVGYVGRLSEQKGLDDLVIAASQIVARRRNVRFVLVGEEHEPGGTYGRMLSSTVETLGIRHAVTFLGYRPDVAAVMRAIDIFVLPSHIEAFPLTVLEAMAAGKPVVATSVGGIPEVVTHLKTGVLVPPRDPARLAEAIERLLDDRALALQMGERGLEKVREQFTIERTLEEIWTLYREVARGDPDRI